MDLGPFSVSLAVKDIHRSLAFYKKLGFEPYDGNPDQNWVLLKNGEARIGLFQGMYNADLLSFSPTDARAVQAHLKAQGVDIEKEIEGDTGPAHLSLRDPDGRVILIDQFND